MNIAENAKDSLSADDTPTEISLDDPSLYLNRELTWLEFNFRVLNEARDPRNPLLERVKFLAIVGSNLDEFFMKRIGGLKQLVGAGLSTRTVDGMTPSQQIDACHAKVRQLEQLMNETFVDLKGLLADQDIHLEDYALLSQQDKEILTEIYEDRFYPLITPQAVDPAHPFPFISNLSLNLLVRVSRPEHAEMSMVRIKVPVGPAMPRFVQIPDASGSTAMRFIRIEDLIADHIDLLLPGLKIETCEKFRVTRNAITEKDEEEADDLLELIQLELRERKFAPTVRLEIEAGQHHGNRTMLAKALGLDRNADVFEPTDMMAYRDLFEIALLDRPELRHELFEPVIPRPFREHANVFDAIAARQEIMVHHPYESFTATVERFLIEAGRDPKVRAIKTTLYRTSEDTRIIDALVTAARNDKQVAVVVELKARFDESANIRWATRLEEAGIHVTYGVIGLKTHCKVIHVIRQEGQKVIGYAHIGTGNYHAGTARMYQDLGLFTCDQTITDDLTELFNYLTTGFGRDRVYDRLLIAPVKLKDELTRRIEREIEHVRAGRSGLIRFKVNALEDTEITQALYRASQAGVKIDLIVRDSCRLRPGIKGLSDNVTVVSIVGRFLEHARVYHFANDGSDEYFFGSADAMKRNLESRVEVVVPITAPPLMARLKEILDSQINDQRLAWEMRSDGSYRQRDGGEHDRGSQQHLRELSAARSKDFDDIVEA